jgi:hypothetical protein
MIISDQEHEVNLVRAAYARELEIYQYQVNIDNYASVLEGLPSTDWPNYLSNYKNANITQLPWEMPETDIDTISDLQYRDRIRALYRSEKAEQAKSKKILEALKLQIGANYDSLVQAYKDSQVTT